MDRRLHSNLLSSVSLIDLEDDDRDGNCERMEHGGCSSSSSSDDEEETLVFVDLGSAATSSSSSSSSQLLDDDSSTSSSASSSSSSTFYSQNELLLRQQQNDESSSPTGGGKPQQVTSSDDCSRTSCTTRSSTSSSNSSSSSDDDEDEPRHQRRRGRFRPYFLFRRRSNQQQPLDPTKRNPSSHRSNNNADSSTVSTVTAAVSHFSNTVAGSGFRRTLPDSQPQRLRCAQQLLFGTLGIYVAYLSYGFIQEDLYSVHHHRHRQQQPTEDEQPTHNNDDVVVFRYVWFLQVLESLASIAVGLAMRAWRHRQQRATTTTSISIFGTPKNHDNLHYETKHNKNTLAVEAASADAIANEHHTQQPMLCSKANSSPTPPTPLTFQQVRPFLWSGTTQVLAKVFMSLSLVAGASYPVVTLAKCGKIGPVMVGQLLLGGSTYKARDCLFAILIVAGTVLLSFGGNNNHDEDSTSGGSRDTWAGLGFVGLSLVMDGCTGGLQKQLLRDMAPAPPTTYDFVVFSHMAMVTVALVIAIVTGDLWRGAACLMEYPDIARMVATLCAWSVIGQSFIFYIICHFDPLVCATITTTRKMWSVLLSIGLKGHVLSHTGYMGLALAIAGLAVEVQGKAAAAPPDSNNCCNSNSSKNDDYDDKPSSNVMNRGETFRDDDVTKTERQSLLGKSSVHRNEEV